jgi:hypothetical protein
MWHVSSRAGRCFVPVVARTDAGYHLDIEPVGVSAVDGASALTALLQQAIGRGNPQVPALLRGQFPQARDPRPRRREQLGGLRAQVDLLDDHQRWTRSPRGGQRPVPRREVADDPTLTVTVAAEAGGAGIASAILRQVTARDDLGREVAAGRSKDRGR